jgi:hypothetical protein
MRAVIAETGVLGGTTRRALDSVVLDDAVATQDTITQLIAAIRGVRRGAVASADHRKRASLADASSPCPSVRGELGVRRISVPSEVIILVVRWYLRFGLSYRDVEELLAERGIDVDSRQHLSVGAAVHAAAHRRRAPVPACPR